MAPPPGGPDDHPPAMQPIPTYHPQFGWIYAMGSMPGVPYPQYNQYNRSGYNGRRDRRHGGGRGGYRGHGYAGGYGYGYEEFDQDEGAQFTFGRDAQHVPWEELVGRIASLTFTQHGSIALQARLDECKPEYVKATLLELKGILSQVMMNKYGSHLTRRLVEMCTESERTEVLREVAPQLVDISKSRFGTWTIQKLVESLDSEEQITIVKQKLTEQVVELTKCPNGNHVIKYCLQTLTPADNQFIYEALTVDIMDIARHKYGCSMLQRCLDYATEEQARLVSDRVAVNALPLIQDAFGNYIVQYVLELGFEESSVAIVDQMVGHFADLAREKFGSNVVEKCVVKAGSDALAVAMLEIMVPGQLESLVGDPYGNYVVQGILESCSDEEAAKIGERIKPQVEALMRTVYGKRIRQKLQKRFPDMFPRRTGPAGPSANAGAGTGTGYTADGRYAGDVPGAVGNQPQGQQRQETYSAGQAPYSNANATGATGDYGYAPQHSDYGARSNANNDQDGGRGTGRGRGRGGGRGRGRGRGHHIGYRGGGAR